MGGGGPEVLQAKKIAEHAVGEYDAVWVCVGGVELGLVCEGDGGAVGGKVVVWVMGVGSSGGKCYGRVGNGGGKGERL